MSDKEEFENILLSGLLKCYQEADEMSGDSKFLIPGNFSIIATNQLKKYNIDISISYPVNPSKNNERYLIKYNTPKDKSVFYELFFDAKVELRNGKIKEIIN